MRHILQVFFAWRALGATEPNSWQLISPDGTVPTPARGYHTAMWSDDEDGFYVYGGQGNGYANKNDLHLYSRQNNSWAEILPGGSVPPARQGQKAVWSKPDDGFYVFGGCCWENDLHLYSRQSNSFQQLSPAGTLPMGREEHEMVWGDSADGFYVCGGYNTDYKWILDLHFYSRASNKWHKLNPTGPRPFDRVHHTLVWSPIDDGFYLFGGWESITEDDGGSWGTFNRNDLYLYSRQANSWQKLEAGGSVPSRREYHSAVWSEANDGFYVFGGYDASGYYLSDLHWYSRQRNEWERLWPTGPIVMARHEHAMVWNPEGFYVLGGRYSTSDYYDDLVLYTRHTTTTTTTQTSITRTTSTQTTITSTSSTFTRTTMTSTITTSTTRTSTITTLTRTSLTTTWTSKTETSTSTSTVPEEAAGVSGIGGINLVMILVWGCFLRL